MGNVTRGAERGLGYDFARHDEGLLIGLEILIHTAILIGRFFSGRPMAGPKSRKTDASFTQPGRTLLHPKDRQPFRWPNGWSALPEWKRAMIRSICLLEAIGLPWGYYGTSMRAEFIWSLCWALITVWVLWVSYTMLHKFRYWRHHRDVVNPLKAGLAPLLGVSPQEVQLTLPLTKVGSDI